MRCSHRPRGECVACVAELRLSYNPINGTIPTTIGNLTQLQLLVVSAAALSGTIPTQVGALPSLSSECRAVWFVPLPVAIESCPMYRCQWIEPTFMLWLVMRVCAVCPCVSVCVFVSVLPVCM